MDVDKNQNVGTQKKRKSSESSKIFGMDFAPLLLPLERRLQTFAVFYWISAMLFQGLIVTSLGIYLFFYTSYWWISLLYLTWMVYDLDTCNRGGRTGWWLRFIRGWRLWKHYKNFFPVKLVKTAELDRNKNYLLGSHPHGVLCSGAFSCFATDAGGFSTQFPGMTPRLLTLEGQFWIPGNRELSLGAGCCAATKRGMEALLGQPGGVAAVLVVGGAPESLNSDKHKVRLVLQRRKGWIKIAMRYGVSLVPTFTFGEAAIYDLLSNPDGSLIRKVQDYLQNIMGFAPVVFFGRGIFQYNFGIIPHRKPMTLVVGAPIKVDKTPEPTVEQINQLHQRYVEALVDLYDKYNPVYGDTSVVLEIGS